MSTEEKLAGLLRDAAELFTELAATVKSAELQEHAAIFYRRVQEAFPAQ